MAIAVPEPVLEAVRTTRIWLADPVGGNPTPLPGTATQRVDTLWSYLVWIIPVGAAFVAAGLCAVIWHRRGQSNEYIGQLALVLAGAGALGAIPPVIGALTGT